MLRRVLLPTAPREVFLAAGVAALIGTAILAVCGSSTLTSFSVGLLVGLTRAGHLLYRSNTRVDEARSTLGTSLLVGVIVASAVGVTQLSLDNRLRELEQQRQRADERQSLQLTIGLHRDLAGIDLSGRDLSGYYLAAKNLNGAILSDADLRDANLSGAILTSASLGGADLRRALVFNADLRRAELIGADLRAVGLQGSDLRDADLIEADARCLGRYCANLTHVNFRGAELGGANLSGALLRDADLRRTELIKADLRGAQLHGADLRRADLRGALVEEATYDADTKWPRGFAPRASGARYVTLPPSRLTPRAGARRSNGTTNRSRP